MTSTATPTVAVEFQNGVRDFQGDLDPSTYSMPVAPNCESDAIMLVAIFAATYLGIDPINLKIVPYVAA